MAGIEPGQPAQQASALLHCLSAKYSHLEMNPLYFCD